MNASTADTVVVSDYISELFPRLSPENVEAASLLYSNLGSPIDQVIAIMNDSKISRPGCNNIDAQRLAAIFVCPTYYLLESFDGRAFKVR